MEIHERIKRRRKELGLSADDLAQALHVSRATVYRYESSYIEKLPLSILEPLCKALHTTPAYIMGWEESSKEEIDLDSFYKKWNEKTPLSPFREICAPHSEYKVRTTKQEKLLQAYEDHPEMQAAVDQLLGVTDDEPQKDTSDTNILPRSKNGKIIIQPTAARSKDDRPAVPREIDEELFKRLPFIPRVKSDDEL